VSPPLPSLNPCARRYLFLEHETGLSASAERLNRDVAPDLRSRVALIGSAAAELRRRGDTLVRGRDLELVIQALGREQIGLGEVKRRRSTDSTGRSGARERTRSG
jgi:hypothetical protein